jgi:hypothetical protein
VIAYGLDDQGSSPGRGKKFVYSPQRPDWLWGPPCLLYKGYQGVKWPGREADRSPPFSAEVKNGGDIPPLPHTSSGRSA